MRRVDALFRLEEKVRGRLAASINRAGALPQAVLSKAFAGERRTGPDRGRSCARREPALRACRTCPRPTSSGGGGWGISASCEEGARDSD